jgi:hypothetical protein
VFEEPGVRPIPQCLDKFDIAAAGSGMTRRREADGKNQLDYGSITWKAFPYSDANVKLEAT